ncbi:hypothetical protein P154DRAFT_571863 [Amniculicola lignicola CBS 123094]|uniref:Uncharacterized protein n=1 Tax=Amniculicola lignicola CBS 123094 TaxID=1392246 RepID=A0A6A5WSJ0_9PLEO|nr:hypothetical protein P154DRAFT_571863 [Amniculicola lignicola CBS 123094]
MSAPFHIPFPKNFLSLNSPHKRSDSASSTDSTDSAASTEGHNFLSNRPVVARKASISSASGSDAVSEPASPPTAPVEAKHKPTPPSFLTLNLKHPVAKASGTEPAADKGGFLSNRH